MKAVSEINPDALEIARKCHEELLSGQSKGKLHGIPFLAKDVFLTTDRMQTTGLSNSRLVYIDGLSADSQEKNLLDVKHFKGRNRALKRL